MTTADLRSRTSALKIQKQAFINDTYMWVILARKAISDLPDTEFTFETPRTRSPQQLRTVSRRHPNDLKSRIINKDIFNSAFVSIVAAVEDYLSKIMSLILKADPQRLKCTISGVKMDEQISIIDFIDKDKDTIIESVISSRLERLFYASPQKQLEYLDRAIGITVDDDTWKKWIEIKARRDIWIHNGGIVNEIYIEKAKDAALCTYGQEATITLQYFQNTVALTKHMIGSIDRKIRNNYPRAST